MSPRESGRWLWSPCPSWALFAVPKVPELLLDGVVGQPPTPTTLGAKTAEASEAESPEAEVGGAGLQVPQASPLQLAVLRAVGRVVSGAGAYPGAFLKRPGGDSCRLTCAYVGGLPAVTQLLGDCPSWFPEARGLAVPSPGCSCCLKLWPLCHILFLEQRELPWALAGGQGGGGVGEQGEGASAR